MWLHILKSDKMLAVPGIVPNTATVLFRYFDLLHFILHKVLTASYGLKTRGITENYHLVLLFDERL